VQELMPFARGVSAKSYAFDAQGNETTIDTRLMRICAAMHRLRWWESPGAGGLDGIGDGALERIRDQMAAA
jgi:hypothetical protein